MRTHRLLIAVSALAVPLMTGLPAHAQVVTSAGGEVTALTQKKIVDRMIVSDSLGTEMARIAVAQTKNPAVREFANQLVTDYRGHLESLRKLADAPDVGRAPAADSSNAREGRVLEQLRTMQADSSFDRTFVTEQVQHQQRTIDNLKKWRAGATNPALQKDIDNAVGVFEGNLSRAQAVAAKLQSP